jgi:hypothetical protein
MLSAKGMTVNTIIVQVADRRWTMRAMHLACDMARNTRSKVVLLHLLRVSNPRLLGSLVGWTPPTPEERQAIRDYKPVAEDYGIEIDVQPMQYESLVDALVQAAEELDASVVFARLPEHRFRLLHQYQTWSLQRQLERQKRQLCLIEEKLQTAAGVPAVRLKVVK